jgi:sec-independent protein translocase protein TatA
MFQIGPQELLLILVVALLVVGPRRLPELGRSIGRGIREIRKAQEEVRKTIQVNLDDDGRPTFDEARGRSQPGQDGKGAAAGDADDAREISRTLGRGLAEIRRARREVERSFRVDIDTRPPSRARQASSATPNRPNGAAESATDATRQVAEAGEDRGEDTEGERDTPQTK